MPSENRHLICKQRLEVTLSSGERTEAMHDALHGMYYARVLPMLDAVFSSMVAEDELVRVDRLDVELGTLSGEALGTAFVDQTEERVRLALQDCMQSLHGAAKSRSAAVFVNQASNERALLEHFLMTGTLPWWAPDAPATDVDTLFSNQLAAAPGALMQTLRTMPTARVAGRIVRQFSPALQRRLIEHLAPESASRIEEWLREWQQVLCQPLPDSSMATRVWTGDIETTGLLMRERVVESLLAGAHSDATLDAIAHECLSALVTRSGASGEALIRWLAPAAGRVLPSVSQLRGWLERQVRAGRTADGESDGRQKTHSARGRRANAAAMDGQRLASGKGLETQFDEPQRSRRRQADDPVTSPIRDEPGAGRSASSGDAGLRGASDQPASSRARSGPATGSAEVARRLNERDDIWDEAGDAHYLQNAGLVLVWPFLPRLFKVLDIVQGKDFKTQAARERAVLLLQHIATGDNHWPEHRLLLNKLLCGIEPADPVPRSVPLRDDEKHAVRDLIEEMIGHWTVLKGTSVDGFRTSFLQREGRLAERGLGWELTIPRVGYDVLIDQLPWGISVVRLPWMKTVVFVQW